MPRKYVKHAHNHSYMMMNTMANNTLSKSAQLQVHDIILLCAFIEPPCPPSPFTKKQLGITKETRYCTLHLLLSHGTKGILWQTRSLGEARNLPKPATTQCQASNSTKKLKLKMTVNNHFETTTLFTHKVDGQQQKLELTPAGFKFSWITSLHFFASPNTPLLGEPFQNDWTFTFVWCPIEDLFIVSWRKLSAPLQPASDIRWWMSSHACIKNSPRKLTWQWNITICNMKKVFRGSIFQCYASLTECAKQIMFAGFFSDCCFRHLYLLHQVRAHDILRPADKTYLMQWPGQPANNILHQQYIQVLVIL